MPVDIYYFTLYFYTMFWIILISISFVILFEMADVYSLLRIKKWICSQSDLR